MADSYRTRLKKMNFKKMFTIFEDNCNKYTRGKTAIIGGSAGMTGSVYMAGRAALRSGCGLVQLCVPKNLSELFMLKVCEEMVFPVSEENGFISDGNFNELLKMLEKCSSLAFGMGASTENQTDKFLKRILKEYRGPKIIDADGLNLLANNISYLNDTENVILTPHTGEFSKLTKIPAEEIERNREKYASDFAKRHNVVVVLKGKDTVVAYKDGIYINKTGNKGMAKGGSGDVLSGITASLAAQGMDIFSAAVAAVYLHGTAGDIAMKKYTEMAMTATDIISCLPDAFRQIL